MDRWRLQPSTAAAAENLKSEIVYHAAECTGCAGIPAAIPEYGDRRLRPLGGRTIGLLPTSAWIWQAREHAEKGKSR